MRIDSSNALSFINLQLPNAPRLKATSGAVKQLVELAIQKNSVRSDNSILESERQARLQKLEKRSDPIVQKMQDEQDKITTEELVEASKEAEKEIKEAIKPDEGDEVALGEDGLSVVASDNDHIDVPPATNNPIPVSQVSSESSIGKIVDIYV